MLTIKEIRKAKGYTLKDVEELTGIKAQTLSKYENGKQQMTVERYVVIANKLGYELILKKV